MKKLIIFTFSLYFYYLHKLIKFFFYGFIGKYSRNIAFGDIYF